MIVVADTSVFLNLVRINHANLLCDLYQSVLAPPEVEAEFRRAAMRYDRSSQLEFPKWVVVRASTTPFQKIASDFALDLGESAAIALAWDLKADLILIDEESGRNAARQLGLRVAGLLGVLLEAKRTGRLSSVAPLLKKLETEAQFWLDQNTKDALLRLADERP